MQKDEALASSFVFLAAGFVGAGAHGFGCALRTSGFARVGWVGHFVFGRTVARLFCLTGFDAV